MAEDGITAKTETKGFICDPWYWNVRVLTAECCLTLYSISRPWNSTVKSDS